MDASFFDEPMDLSLPGEELLKVHSFEKFERAVYKQARELLAVDGWKSCNSRKKEPNKYVFVMDDCGCIQLRWLEWDEDYSEWSETRYIYPCFYLSEHPEEGKDYQEVDDNTRHLVYAEPSDVKITDSTLKAFALLRKLQEVFEDSYKEKT